MINDSDCPPPELIPVLDFYAGFTTSYSIKHHLIKQLPLADDVLGVHKISSRTSHRVVKPPAAAHTPEEECALAAPKEAWEACYPKGSINPTAEIPGGFSFYLAGPESFARCLQSGATDVVVSYRMMLEPGWEWVKGGKLPGLFGGVGDLAYSCSGGRQEHRCQCFNLRPMWRTKSAGELYTYLPLTPGNACRLLSVPPTSKENADYGFSVGRGSFHLDIAVGRWVSLAFRVKLNDVGDENGEVHVWMYGKCVISINGLVLRASEEARIKGMHFQTFFGGHTPDWASPKDQHAWFADITGVIIK